MDIEDELGFGVDMSIGELSGRQRYYVKNLKTGVIMGPFDTKKVLIRAIKQLICGHPYEIIIAEPGSITRG